MQDQASRPSSDRFGVARAVLILAMLGLAMPPSARSTIATLEQQTQEQQEQQEQQGHEGSGQDTLRFIERVELVSVPVAVTDKKEGGLVADLTIEDFRIFEDGEEQEIRLFTSGLDESWLDLPPNLKEELSGKQVMGLIVDVSGSMENDMPLIREAALKFLTNVPKTEQLFILDFDENIRLSSYSSDDQRMISERIYEIEADGWTALYDAVATVLDRTFDYDGRKTLVVFSDGVDSRSTLGIGEVMDFVKAYDVTIHSIHFGAASRPGSARNFRDSRFMRDIAAQTGGSYFAGTSLKKLDEAYDKILEELFSQYLIGYVSTNTEKDGKYRKIEVKVDRDNVKWRARRGYLAPAPPLEDTPGR